MQQASMVAIPSGDPFAESDLRISLDAELGRLTRDELLLALSTVAPRGREQIAQAFEITTHEANNRIRSVLRKLRCRLMAEP